MQQTATVDRKAAKQLSRQIEVYLGQSEGPENDGRAWSKKSSVSSDGQIRPSQTIGKREPLFDIDWISTNSDPKNFGLEEPKVFWQNRYAQEYNNSIILVLDNWQVNPVGAPADLKGSLEAIKYIATSICFSAEDTQQQVGAVYSRNGQLGPVMVGIPPGRLTVQQLLGRIDQIKPTKPPKDWKRQLVGQSSRAQNAVIVSTELGRTDWRKVIKQIRVRALTAGIHILSQADYSLASLPRKVRLEHEGKKVNLNTRRAAEAYRNLMNQRHKSLASLNDQRVKYLPVRLDRDIDPQLLAGLRRRRNK